METPRLDHVFLGMLRRLRFGIMVWAIHVVTTVLWLINYYLEYSFLREESWAPIRPGLLSIMGLSLVNIVMLYYLQRRISGSFRDYVLRCKMTTVSPTLGDIYSTTHPLLQALEELLNRDVLAFATIFVSSLIGALSYSILLLGTVMQISLLTNVLGGIAAIAGYSYVQMFWIKRLIFYGVNSVLLWIFVIWSGLGSLRSYRIHEYLAGDYENEILPPRIRELAEELESGRDA